jgi:hypothetical protein
MTKTSEFPQMHIADPRAPQFYREDLPAELRVVPGSRDTANVYYALNAMRPQNVEEIFPSVGRMPNGKDTWVFDSRLPHDR